MTNGKIYTKNAKTKRHTKRQKTKKHTKNTQKTHKKQNPFFYLL